ncbi:oligosaccharide flippase family protein [Terrimonas ferruginea]|uniref:oligosaccharide flippase family protein n=1 Tax=Terrimonas ferruginea TaxID=249 RepID=UPI0004106409|nr:lipopolysaccharide biosynthesis protein [Terrimonas ferruginea]
MSTIRRQSIISSVVIYLGFAIGFVNTFFFTKDGWFTPEQYGLTSIFVAVATLMTSFATMAMPAYIYKFYHYYNDHLSPKKSDMVAWSILLGIIGFILVMVAGIVFKPLVIRKFGSNSGLFVDYYNWVFPMALGLTIFTILESLAWNMGKSVLTNFLKEVQWRAFTTLLILLFLIGVIGNFDLFIKFYSLGYLVIALTLLAYLVYTKRIYFYFRVTKITRRFFRKILLFCAFFFSSGIVFNLSQVFDSIVIASVLKDGLAKAGVFTLAQLMTSLIQAPQRSIISAAIPHLSRSWKDKNYGNIQRIYQRSSINLLLFAAAMYILILLNYNDAVITFKLNSDYLAGFSAFIFLGLTRVIDLGTGVNAQIIATSNYWKFELITGIILLGIMLPVNIVMTREFDIVGPAIANLIGFTLYNAIRVVFLWRKFKFFPFNIRSLYTLLLGGIAFLVSWLLFRNSSGVGAMVARSATALVIYGGGALLLRISPDVMPIWQSVLERLGLQKKKS